MGELTVSVAKAIAEGQGATAWEVYQLARSFLHAHGIEAPAFAAHPQPVTPAGGEVEPVGEVDIEGRAHIYFETGELPNGTKLYTHPPVADAALVRDAERYRFLIPALYRDDFTVGEAAIQLHTTGPCPTSDDIGAAIDAALNQRGGGDHG